jgi:DNA repair protein RecN (Recombination protein N)
MLTHLTIENFAIIDRIDLELGPGLVALTGETGAGKSIVIDAVGGVLGSRLGTDVVRTGAESARVEAIFVSPASDALRAILEEFGIPLEDDTLIVSREISRSGRTVARVNGRAVPLSCLQRIGRVLVDVHGQGDHLTLLRVSEHLRFLDGYAGLEAKREHVGHLAAEIRAIRAEREALNRDQRELARQVDLLRFQIEEIDAARLQPGEDEDLRQERTLLTNAEKLATAVDLARQALSEMEGGSALDRLGTAAEHVTEIARLDSSMSDARQTLDLLIDQVNDLSRQLRRYQEQIEFNPDRLEEIEERLNLIRTLLRKYGSTIEDVLAFADEARQQLNQLVHREEHVAELDRREQEALSACADAATSLSEARQEAARRLAADVERELAELNMAGARFRVAISQDLDPNGVPLPDGRTVAFDSTGIDKVEFYIAPNAGEDFKPLLRVVSGGETARLMLALKNILSRADTVPTLIFDEIDSGIGGRTAIIVGQKIARLARHHQIICVTHLSQIAAFADVHIVVSKNVADGRTSTQAKILGMDGRIEELATMVGGQGDRSSARDHARDSLRSAEDWKANHVHAERGAR